MTEPEAEGPELEIQAIGKVYNALRGLDPDAQRRVLGYVSGMLGVAVAEHRAPRAVPQEVEDNETLQDDTTINQSAPAQTDVVADNLDGISPVAQKWIRRSGISIQELSKVYSIGLDDIDLIAEKVPGANKKERMRSVLLLKGIAAYLATGAARVSHEQVKEACLHYDAYDGNNFAAYLKSFASEVSGTKESGYTLTPRGITAATELAKRVISPIPNK